MSLLGEQILLRAFLRSGDRAPHVPTHVKIVQAARSHKLAGATVLKGLIGYGHHGIARQSPWSLVQHEPVIVEIVDSAEKISAFVEGPLRTIMTGGLLTLERAAVTLYRRRDQDDRSPLHLANALTPLSTVPRWGPGDHVTTQQDGVLVRIFIGDSDRFENKPLHEAILATARDLGLAGATVLRGTDGFGANSVVHKAALLEMSSDLPVVIEIVDAEERIKLLLPHLEKMVTEGMITLEHVVICAYRHNPADAPAGK